MLKAASPRVFHPETGPTHVHLKFGTSDGKPEDRWFWRSTKKLAKVERRTHVPLLTEYSILDTEEVGFHFHPRLMRYVRNNFDDLEAVRHLLLPELRDSNVAAADKLMIERGLDTRTRPRVRQESGGDVAYVNGPDQTRASRAKPRVRTGSSGDVAYEDAEKQASATRQTLRLFPLPSGATGLINGLQQESLVRVTKSYAASLRKKSYRTAYNLRDLDGTPLFHNGRRVRGTEEDRRKISEGSYPAWFGNPEGAYTRWFPDTTDQADVEARAVLGTDRILLWLEDYQNKQKEARESQVQANLEASATQRRPAQRRPAKKATRPAPRTASKDGAAAHAAAEVAEGVKYKAAQALRAKVIASELRAATKVKRVKIATSAMAHLGYFEEQFPKVIQMAELATEMDWSYASGEETEDESYMME